MSQTRPPYAFTVAQKGTAGQLGRHLFSLSGRAHPLNKHTRWSLTASQWGSLSAASTGAKAMAQREHPEVESHGGEEHGAARLFHLASLGQLT